MINQNADYIEKRFREFWNKENHDRPLISVFAPKDSAKPFAGRTPDTLKERWTDMEYVVAHGVHGFENTFFGGEAHPVLNPNLGPDIYGAVLGDCEIEYGETTSWSLHNVSDWERSAEWKLDRNNRWFRAITDMTRYAVEECKGRYFVGVTDVHSGMDALTSLRGPEELCMDQFDCPEQILKKLRESEAVYDKFMTQLFAITAGAQKGTANWMQIYHPDKKWYVTSCDFSCLVSGADFDTFVKPTVLHELDFLEASMYHLDGIAALRHLDALLSLKKLNGIQWVYGAGQPTARAWKDVLTRIQAAGKNIQVTVTPDDVEEVCGFLASEGVHLTCWVNTESEARRVIETADRVCKQKRAQF